MIRIFRCTSILTLLAVVLAACRAQPTAEPATVTQPPFPTVLTVMTHDSFSISGEVLMDFERAHNAKVQFVKAGDAGTMLNKAILAKDHPLADVLYGVDNTFLCRALQEDIFEPMPPRPWQTCPTTSSWIRRTAPCPSITGDVCLNVDRAYFREHGLKLPCVPR